jgi:hypothetical protein
MPPINKNIDPKDLPAYLAVRRDLKRIERSNAGKVLRRLAKGIAPSGYRRKSTFFARETGHLIQFLHVHKFSFGPQFRMHVCLRVLNEPQSFVALQGIDSGDFAGYRSLSFEDNESSIIRCAERMAAFVSEVAEPWFAKWQEEALLRRDSPLYRDAQEALAEARSGKSDPVNANRSRVLLGLPIHSY